MKAPNFGIQPTGIQQVDSGFATGTQQISRATKIVKFYIPGTKFKKSGILQYENNTTQLKFFDYHFMIYAYSNWDTRAEATAYFVGRMNDCHIKKRALPTVGILKNMS